MSGDSVDDTKACHAAIRMKQTIVHIPIKEGAAFWGGVNLETSSWVVAQISIGKAVWIPQQKP